MPKPNGFIDFRAVKAGVSMEQVRRFTIFAVIPV